jgi:hypothetical protein
MMNSKNGCEQLPGWKLMGRHRIPLRSSHTVDRQGTKMRARK